MMSGISLPMLVDTHCHLDFPEYDPDRDAVIARARDKGVYTLISIGSTVERSFRCVELARQYPEVFATVGCHPHDAHSLDGERLKQLAELARQPRVVAVGEIGLDYYRNLSPVEDQKRVFVSLIELAQTQGLPLVIHSRQASGDTLDMLRSNRVSRAIIHCFSGDEEFLKECLASGYYVSFTCNVTYKKSEAVRDMVRQAPLERICLETDAPYLSPEGFRGRRNEPAFVETLCRTVAEIKQISVEDVARITTDNAVAFFGLPVQR